MRLESKLNILYEEQTSIEQKNFVFKNKIFELNVSLLHVSSKFHIKCQSSCFAQRQLENHSIKRILLSAARKRQYISALAGKKQLKRFYLLSTPLFGTKNRAKIQMEITHANQ